MPRSIQKSAAPLRVAAGGLPFAMVNRPLTSRAAAARATAGSYGFFLMQPPSIAPPTHRAISRQFFRGAVYDLQQVAGTSSMLPGVGTVHHSPTISEHWRHGGQLIRKEIEAACQQGWKLVRADLPADQMEQGAAIFLLAPPDELFAVMHPPTMAALAAFGIVPERFLIRQPADLRRVTGTVLSGWAKRLHTQQLFLWARIEPRRGMIGFDFGREIPRHLEDNATHYGMVRLRRESSTGHWMVRRAWGYHADRLAQGLRNSGILVPVRPDIRKPADFRQITPRMLDRWAASLGGTAKIAIWWRDRQDRVVGFGLGRRVPEELVEAPNYHRVLFVRSRAGQWRLRSFGQARRQRIAALFTPGGLYPGDSLRRGTTHS